MINAHQQRAYVVASGALISLVVLCIAWEMVLAPLRPGGSWVVLKALPLLLPLRGVLRKENYTMQWTSMLIWLYFTEGCVRAYSDKTTLSTFCAIMEIVLSLLYFVAILVYLRPLKQAAKAQRRANG
ncbi:DUF2069 domain-containing protein [Undibacterium sp. MH2W]|uniref:DUF2069 domain-containing protein n=1 Tax=Undibacterium sp. MH2W TaxID=3413044 RepID=UPI003BF3FF1B